MNERPKNAENARITEKQQTRKYRFHSALCDDATTISINKQHRTTTAQVQKKTKKKQSLYLISSTNFDLNLRLHCGMDCL